MTVGVIIVTYNSAAWIEKAVRSVFKSRGGFKRRVVVVDNCSKDNTRPLLITLQRKYPIELVFSPRNSGFATGVNQGLQRLGFKFENLKLKIENSAKLPEAVLLLNPDAQLAPEALKILVSRLKGKAGIVAPKMVYPDGRPQASNFGRFPTWRTQLVRALKLHKILPWGHYIHPQTVPADFFRRERAVDWVSGGAMLIKRELIEKVGFWDENFFLYVEDIDYCRRARLAGFEVRYVPKALVYHKLGASFERIKNQESRIKNSFSRVKRAKDWERESLQYYFRKYAGAPKLHWAATDLHREPAGLARLDFIERALKARFGFIAGLRLLDAGAGRGSLARALSQQGGQVTALEKDAATAAALKSLTAGQPIKVVKADIRRWSASVKYDAVILSELLEHLSEPEALLKRGRRLLNAGGLILVTVPNGRGLEERLRFWGLKTGLGRRLKALFQRLAKRQGQVQTLAQSPHRQFLSLRQWRALFQAAHFKVVAQASQSAGFKGWYYVLGRLFLKRDSAWFRRLDRLDAFLARYRPTVLGDGFMFALTPNGA